MHSSTGKHDFEGTVSAGEGNRRNEDREHVYLKTLLIVGGDASIDAELVNISASGFLVRTNASFDRRTRLRLALPMLGDMPAEVMWSLAGCVGCQFIFLIEERDFPRLLAAIRQAKPGWTDKRPN